MDRIIWKLRNIGSGEVLNISTSVFKVGRSVHADLTSVHSSVSRSHATLSILIDGVLYVTDNKSCNGTFINNVKIPPMEIRVLRQGDIVGFGCCPRMCQDQNFETPPLIFEVIKVDESRNAVENDCKIEPMIIDLVDDDDDVKVEEVKYSHESNEKQDDLVVAVDFEDDRAISPVHIDKELKVVLTIEDIDGTSTTSGGEEEKSKYPIKDENLACVQDNSMLKVVPVCENPEGTVTDKVCKLEKLKILKKQIEDELLKRSNKNDKEEDIEPEHKTGSSVMTCTKEKPHPIEIDKSCSSSDQGKSLTPGKNGDNVNTYAIELELVDEVIEPPGQDGFSKANEEFYAQDNCIVISDGEDDDNSFACSQIFQLSERIKKEQVSLIDGADPYAEIKKELADLDYCDNEYGPLVDLTYDVDHFDSTSDLINVLENPSLAASNPNRKKGEQDHAEKEPEEAEQGEDILEEAKRLEEKKDCTPCPSSTRDNCSSAYTPASKYCKPPIVAPHIDVKPRVIKESSKKLKTKESPKGTEEKKTRTKRQSSASTAVPEKKFKRGSSLAGAKCDKKSISEEFCKRSGCNSKNKLNADSKQLIAIERKKKLKEISEKEHSKANHEVTMKQQKNVAKIKTSESRGKFLTNPVRPPVPVKHAHNSTSRQTKGKSTEDKQADTDEQNFHKSIKSIEEDLVSVVNWCVYWLYDQEKKQHTPPVAGKKIPQEIPLSFKSYSDYCNIIHHMILLELWQFVYQTAYNKDDQVRKPHQTIMKHIRHVGPLTYIDLECYLTLDDVRLNNAVRIDDLCIIEVKANGTRDGTFFGFVKLCNWTTLSQNSVIRNELRQIYIENPNMVPHTHLKITMVTCNIENKPIRSDRVFIKGIVSLASHLRLFRTLKYLEKSPICKQIVNPSPEDFQVAMEHIDLISEENLNPEQRDVVLEACSLCLGPTPGLYLIKGPPGTGKSNVIVNIVFQLLVDKIMRRQKPPLILLTAPSNAAVDGLILKLAERRAKFPSHLRNNIRLVRMGPELSISYKVDRYKLNSLARNNIIKDHHFLLSEEYKVAMENNKVDQFLRKQLGDHYSSMMKAAEDKLIAKSNIICTTLNSCVNARIMEPCRRQQLKFACCIIDEATQCNEVESLLPIQLGIDKFIIVGDPQQLPAVVVNKEAQRLGYGKSLLSRIDLNFRNQSSLNPIKMLRKQYRMRKEICEYPNRIFYGAMLESVANHPNRITPPIRPYLIFNLTRNENHNEEYVNHEEAVFIYKLLHTLKQYVNPSCKYTIGIISPYKAQKDLLVRTLADIRFNSNVSMTINTVDSFQGMEDDIIIISSVRYSSNYFLESEQRLNVALTRAKQALYIIGNYTLFKHSKPFYNLREDAKKRKLLFDVKDSAKNLPSLHKYITEPSNGRVSS